MKNAKSIRGRWLALGICATWITALVLGSGLLFAEELDLDHKIPCSLIIPPGGHHDMTSDATYYNVTVGDEATLDTHGYILTVTNRLTNYGYIIDSTSGGDGGAGGSAGGAGRGCPRALPGAGAFGNDGGAPSVSGAGYGGDGGDGGSGGGAAWSPCVWCWPFICAWGGNGGNGGVGGPGGGSITIYTKELDNQGVIEADGENGGPGVAGRDGGFDYGTCNLSHHDQAGGGGGGGAGGNGGHGGTVTIYYEIVVNLNLDDIHANGGLGGLGGGAGESQCYRLEEPYILCQCFDWGAPATGRGGRGGESDVGTGCGTHTADPGYDGLPGEPGSRNIIQQ